MGTIKLYRSADGWMAVFSDPQVVALFGSDTLPTAYTAKAAAEAVLAGVRRLNPGVAVSIG